MRYIDAEKLIKSVNHYQEGAKAAFNPIEDDADYYKGKIDACEDIHELITSLQQSRPKTDVKSPFTGGKVTILSREEEVTFRGEKIKATRKYYRCEDTGREFTDSKLDDDMMWSAFRAYCEKKRMTSFTDIVLKQEQPEGLYNKAAKFWYEHCELNKTKDQRILILNAPTFTELVNDIYELGLNARKEE